MQQQRQRRFSKLFSKTPIAWLQLTYQMRRFFTASLGIAAAVTLMFAQLGFLGALNDSNTVLHKQLRAELVMLSPETEALVLLQNFSRRRLYQALALDEVESVTPMYFARANFKNVKDGRNQVIIMFGINPENSVFGFPTLDAQLTTINEPDTVLFDRYSRPEYGTVVADLEAGERVLAEIDGEDIEIGGIVDFLGVSFGINGSIVTSDINFLRLSPQQHPENIALGFITLKPDADPAAVAAKLNALIPSDALTLTKEDFIVREEGYWRSATPVGFIFQTGAVVGFLIGMYIVYQILYTDISDHIPDYAILKAKGYQKSYFWGMLVQEAAILSVSSFIPGYLLALVLYRIVKAGTNLPIYMPHDRAIIVFCMTIFMCVVSGLLVSKKLDESDPADLF
ncbi:MAG: ABC transporter permease DevC [Cyanobacteria bacterium P01_G01_bin.54]